ncbi:MAG TPA: hypothetical protein VM509_06585 [Planctomycetota bacterium]|nr:hypothetical protein [Planctomycetota bacterium]
MSIWLALAILQAAPVEVASPDGLRIARIEKEHVTVFALDGGERHELWDAPFRSGIEPAKYALSNSGRVLAQIAEHFNESHTLVRIQVPEQDPVLWSGRELGIPRQILGGTGLALTWLDETRAPAIAWADTWFGPCLELELPLRGGAVCAIDVARKRIVEHSIAPPPARVEPAVQGELPERSAVPYVNGVEAAPVARAGLPFEITIRASHATPGWTLLGFELEARGSDGRELVLTPRSAAPDGVNAQVVSSFRTTAKLADLRPGRYTLDVNGWSAQHVPLTIDVVPDSLLVSLRTRGGFAGIDQRIEIHTPAVARIDRGRGAAVQFAELSDAKLHTLLDAVASLPPKDRRADTKNSADLFEHTLQFWSNDRWITIEVDDHAATDPERAAIEALRSL